MTDFTVVLQSEEDLVVVTRSRFNELIEIEKESKRRKEVVHYCTICGFPIYSHETFIGTGNGTGNRFAHETCYYRKEIEKLSGNDTY